MTTPDGFGRSTGVAGVSQPPAATGYSTGVVPGRAPVPEALAHAAGGPRYWLPAQPDRAARTAPASPSPARRAPR